MNETISKCSCVADFELRMTEWKYLISTYNNTYSVHSSTFSSRYLTSQIVIHDYFKNIYILIGRLIFMAISYESRKQLAHLDCLKIAREIAMRAHKNLIEINNNSIWINPRPNMAIDCKAFVKREPIGYWKRMRYAVSRNNCIECAHRHTQWGKVIYAFIDVMAARIRVYSSDSISVGALQLIKPEPQQTFSHVHSAIRHVWCVWARIVLYTYMKPLGARRIEREKADRLPTTTFLLCEKLLAMTFIGSTVEWEIKTKIEKICAQLSKNERDRATKRTGWFACVNAAATAARMSKSNRSLLCVCERICFFLSCSFLFCHANGTNVQIKTLYT